MKIKKDELAIAVLLPLAVGSVASCFVKDAMFIYESMEKPPLSPPGWIFPFVWFGLYVLMGIGSYLIYQMDENDKDVKNAILLYVIQLGVNFFWPILFFKYSLQLFALIWIILLFVLVVMLIKAYRSLDKRAAVLMIPYAVWLLYAAYLNLGIYLLNK